MPRCHKLLAVVLAFTALTFFVDSTSAAAFKRVHKGEQAPAFTLNDLAGNPVNLEDYREGPLTIVVFWALWSPKSIPLLRDIQGLMEEFGDQGLKGKALAIDAEGQQAPADLEAQLKEFAQKQGLTFPILVDKNLEQYNAWGVIATPSTAFLGKDLTVLYEFSGHPTSAYADMREQVMKALGLEEEVAAATKPKRERYHADKRVTLNFGLARTLFERGQFARAASKLKKILEDDPAFPDAHALNGVIHLGLEAEDKEGAAETARESFQKALELDGTLPLALAGMAHFALAEGDAAKAVELSRKAARYTEDDELPPPGRLGEAAPAQEAQEGTPAGDTTPGADRRAAVKTRLDLAEAALGAGNGEEAQRLTFGVVDAFLGIPEGPEMKGKGLKILQMKKKDG